MQPKSWTRLCVVLLSAICATGAAGAEPASGWRGNATGLWPQTTAPTTWKRLAHGALEGARAQADQPAGEAAGDAPLVQKGLIAEWLTLGPLPVADSVQNFDDDLLSGEAAARPHAGQRTADQSWQKLTAPLDDPMVFGTAEMPFVALAKGEKFAINRIGYAHAYVHSPRGGLVRGVLDHCFGLKLWLNGQPMYQSVERHVGLGSYPGISRSELENTAGVSGQFEGTLKPGWNRLLIKLSSPNRAGFTDMNFCLRLMDPPSVNYETQNIRWMAELPARSTSTPIVVGDRVFLMAEPDELLCFDKRTGRRLWSAANNYYEALTADERKALPALATRVDPLVQQLAAETNLSRRRELRHDIQAALVEIDSGRFKLNTDGHFESHLGIVGFTMPTPVSDGTRVYVWCGLGVAACYELDGRRLWITRVPLTDPLAYGSSPALADGVLGVFMGKLFGLDAKTGEVLWNQPRINRNIAAIMSATLGGQPVFVTQLGVVLRPRDGHLLFRPRETTTGDGGAWAPPLLLGNTMYLPKYGVLHLSIYDFSAVEGDAWKPESKGDFDLDLPREIHLRADGSWLDRSTASSVLVHQGLLYEIDMYGWLYVVDLETHKVVYYKNLELDGLMHYNAIPVAASPTLVGENLVVMDNQGTALVLATGREFRLIARNRIETQLERQWPIPAQETLAYAPPVADGDSFYLRGERYLYCIGR